VPGTRVVALDELVVALDAPVASVALPTIHRELGFDSPFLVGSVGAAVLLEQWPIEHFSIRHADAELGLRIMNLTVCSAPAAAASWPWPP
jgi:hypothetical protein